VPDGVLFGSSKAHKALRQILVEHQRLDAIISMPSGVFKPYAGVSTAILFFTKTNPLGKPGAGGTDHVWFYDMQSDGFSLDDKRTPQPDKSDLPDILARWQNREAETTRKRTDRSFLVPKAEIASNDYDLSINRYKEVEYEAVEHDSPQEILQRLAKLEEEIAEGGRSWRGCWDEHLELIKHIRRKHDGSNAHLIAPHTIVVADGMSCSGMDYEPRLCPVVTPRH
jgi:type I restriction enzyme M protein